MGLTSRKKRPLNRKIEHLNDTNIIWVAIEGTTKVSKEHRYFNIFQKRDRRYQLFIIGNKEGKSSPDFIIENLKEAVDKHEIRDDDDFWLVIDVDRWGQKKLALAAQYCQDCGFNLAVSNPCFEIWLLYHYQEIKDELNNCNDVKPILNSHTENDPNNEKGYREMFAGNIELAVDRAKEDDTDKEARWPNHLGSRVYRIIEAIWEQER